MRIAIGKSRKDIKWKTVDISWEELVAKLSKTFTTSETMSEYKAMSKDERADRKDVGGFVGGVVVKGRRTKDNVTSRSLITLDADFATPTAWGDVEALFDNAMCCYSTHSHTTKAPRLRFVIPLDREVTPEEYEPIARRVAADIGIDMFDVTTYETSRLMYWPSTSVDGDFFFRKMEGPILSADSMLARYKDWHDTLEWPLGATESRILTKQAKSQGDPESKPGMVGLFCRTYDIHSAIETFLPKVYTACDGGRYTYVNGSTTAGAVVYNNGRFLFSHHSTDPASGVLCNAFDLVRLHKFSELDYEVDRETPITKLPSYKAMCDFASKDKAVKKLLAEENLASAAAAFKDDVALDWTEKLSLTSQGAVDTTTDNLLTILDNDPNLAGTMAINEFKHIPCKVADLPWARCTDTYNGEYWTDDDFAALTHYIETTYGIFNQTKLSTAVSVCMGRHSYHPVRDYLNALRWDGTKRAEKLFVHYLGAENTKYTRTVTRKWLTAAVARVMDPGCKFDNLVVLVGAQGIGKSYLGSKLGKGWFSDTFSTVQGKEAYEQLKGCWIVEIAELSAMKKAEVEAVKMFISKQEDNYRGAYKRFASTDKRQCVFYGTTNDDEFLRDYTGNRRFWPIGVSKETAAYSVFDLTDEDINQIWAEAVTWYKSGESLYLPQDVSEEAREVQAEYMVRDPRQEQIIDYLNKPIPVTWAEMDRTERRNYIQGFTTYEGETMPRDFVSIVEVAYELFGVESLDAWKAREYHNLMSGIRGWKKGKQKRTQYGVQIVYTRDNGDGNNEETNNADKSEA